MLFCTLGVDTATVGRELQGVVGLRMERERDAVHHRDLLVRGEHVARDCDEIRLGLRQ